MTPHRNLMITLLLGCGLLAACGKPDAKPADDHGASAAEAFERGPHRGRMLRDGDFAVEVTIFEDGAEPQFRVYAYLKDKPVDPRQVQLSIALTRLGGKLDRFAFRPQEGFLVADGAVVEPHSFDVEVKAGHAGRQSAWRYASYEGRTIISAEAAKAGGVKVETAGPVELGETLDLTGRVELTPQGRAEVRAWYPGRVLVMSKTIGDAVRKGQVIARVESSYSLQGYNIPAPISGVIVERNANPGGAAGEAPIYVIADPNSLHAEFFLYPRDAERVRPGQSIAIKSLSGDQTTTATIEAIPPGTDPFSQTSIAHVELPAGGGWRPGVGVTGKVTVGSAPAPLAVRTRALQRFRDFTVVYVRVGTTYEVRMLTLGRRTPEWTEVLGGLEPGAVYVTDGAFLIRADIDKSGASHDH